jgi:hypothetical protein
LLGRPLGAAVQSPGAMQPFEGGRMLYTEQAPGRGRAIMVLCGGEQSGRVISQQPIIFFSDTWEAGQDPGGGPAPVAGRYYPGHGFGKVWREHPEVQQCLGYATTAAETGLPITVQPFQGGYMVLSDTPAERATYVIWGGNSCNSCGVDAFYERYPVPLP